jgi:imidazolonepropionase
VTAAASVKLWRNARLATGSEPSRVIQHGALATSGDRIEWVGEERALPQEIAGRVSERFDLGGRWVTAGLIDCHTHLVFAGTRSAESAARLRGESYEDIARRGGGILTTVRATRAASEQQLIDESAPRLESLLAEGVTTVEIKSGYALTLEGEAKMLRAARRLAELYPVRVHNTLLAAHTVPAEFAGRADEYIDTVAGNWLPRLHAEGLVDSVDVFCERIAFSTAHAERLFEAARSLSVPVRMHAEQLSNIGATQLAARYRALSCDHLEHASREDVAAMARAGSIAVLLPVAFFCLAEKQKPPVAALREQGVPIAVASDCNPGSAPGASLLLALGMASRSFGLAPEELLDAVTKHAARALGVESKCGRLTPGLSADFAVWNVSSLDELGYWVGFNPCWRRVYGGTITSTQGGFPPRNTARLESSPP